MHQPSSWYKRHRFPGEGISHAVLLYYRFLLRYRDVEELLAERGIAANSHRPTRRRERVLQRFKSPEHAQQFLSPFGPISNHFHPRRHLLPALKYHVLLQTRFVQWRELTGLAAA